MDKELEAAEDAKRSLGHASGSDSGSGSGNGNRTEGECSGNGRGSSSASTSQIDFESAMEVENQLDISDKETRLDVYFVVMAILLATILVGVLLYFSIVTISDSRIEVEIPTISNLSLVTNFTQIDNPDVVIGGQEEDS